MNILHSIIEMHSVSMNVFSGSSVSNLSHSWIVDKPLSTFWERKFRSWIAIFYVLIGEWRRDDNTHKGDFRKSENSFELKYVTFRKFGDFSIQAFPKTSGIQPHVLTILNHLLLILWTETG